MPPSNLPKLNDPMTPSATHHRRSSPCADAPRRCRRNAAAGIVAGTPTATARALAAGLWRLRHAERQAVNPNSRRHVAPVSALARCVHLSLSDRTVALPCCDPLSGSGGLLFFIQD